MRAELQIQVIQKVWEWFRNFTIIVIVRFRWLWYGYGVVRHCHFSSVMSPWSTHSHYSNPFKPIPCWFYSIYSPIHAKKFSLYFVSITKIVPQFFGEGAYNSATFRARFHLADLFFNRLLYIDPKQSKTNLFLKMEIIIENLLRFQQETA